MPTSVVNAHGQANVTINKPHCACDLRGPLESLIHKVKVQLVECTPLACLKDLPGKLALLVHVFDAAREDVNLRRAVLKTTF